MPVAALAAPLAAELGGGLFATLGSDALVGAGLGAGGGALLGEVTGSKNIGMDALGGALGGGITGGLSPVLGSAFGSPLAGGIAAGGLGGLAQSAVTGGNPLMGALTGGAIGGATSGFGVDGTATTPAASAGGGASAASLAGGGALAFGGGDSTSLPGNAAIATGAPLGASATGIGTSGGDLSLGGSVPALSGGAIPAGAFLGTDVMAGAGGNIQPLASTGADSAMPGADSGLPVAGVGASGGQGIGPFSPDAALASIVSAAPFDASGAAVTGGQVGQGLFDSGSSTTALTAPQLSSSLAGNQVGGLDTSSVWNWLKANPGLLLGGGLLGYEMLQGNQQYPQQAALQGLATQAQSEAASLAAPAQTGVLPPGEQAAVDQAVQGAKAQTVGTYGSLGLSGSTMEAQALGGANLEGAALKASIANNLLAQSANFSRIAGQDYTTVLQAEMAQDAALRQALASFAGGLAGLRAPAA